MSVLNNSLLLGAPAGGAAGYSISRSLRFNSADSAYLSRTPASAGNRKTWTWAGWVKRSDLTNQQTVWSAGSTGTNRSNVLFQGSGEIRFFNYAGSVDVDLVTTPVYRDASAWYHLVFVVDTTQATSTNRFKLYVNGVQVTVFGTATYPSLNQDLVFNSAIAHGIGRGEQSGGEYFSGYLSDIHFIDGQALDPTSFGEFSATTGVWVPKAYTGSYGTNGSQLKFEDNSSNTATTLGKDTSGNGNNWTPNNLSVTAGAGNDSLVDVPTNGSEVDTGLGGQVRGNYCCWNPLNNLGGSTLSNGNLDVTTAVSGGGRVAGTIGVSSGKWYWEITPSSLAAGSFIGIAPASRVASGGVGDSADEYAYYDSGQKYTNATTSSYGASYAANDVIGCALNLDAGTLTFYKNGSSQGQAFSGITGVYVPALSDTSGGSSSAFVANFGQRPFAYTAPSGFKALCTANLPAPTIVKPSTVFDTKLYTSNAGTLTVSGLGFSPDFAWLKSRGTAVAHALYDTVRGAGYALSSNLTDAEKYATDGFVSFNSDGFTLGANNNSPQPDINYTNNIARVAWCWDAGSSTVTNTAGSITSQVRANASAGFSVVTFTPSGASSVGHGLGVAPALIIVKNRSISDSWYTYHVAVGTGKYMVLNSTAAALTGANGFTSVSASTFTVGADVISNYAHVAYCFAPVAGLSAFGSYTGNGSADGPFVYTGFRPRWVMIKITNTGTSIDHWVMWDTARDDYNVADSYLLANNPQQEVTSSAVTIDALSNGFKLRNSSINQNGSGSTYIYAAFAEAPFQYARAR